MVSFESAFEDLGVFVHGLDGFSVFFEDSGEVGVYGGYASSCSVCYNFVLYVLPPPGG